MSGEPTMPRVSKCDRTADCPEPLEHHERCPKFDAEFWSKVQIRNRGEESTYDFSPAPDAVGIEAALAAGLAAHAYRPSAARGIERCGCGESAVGQPGWHRAHVAAALLPVVTQAQAAERERIAQAIEAGPWGRGMPNGMHMEAIRACARIARADESGARRAPTCCGGRRA